MGESAPQQSVCLHPACDDSTGRAHYSKHGSLDASKQPLRQSRRLASSLQAIGRARILLTQDEENKSTTAPCACAEHRLHPFAFLLALPAASGSSFYRPLPGLPQSFVTNTQIINSFPFSAHILLNNSYTSYALSTQKEKENGNRQSSHKAAES